MAQNTIWLGQYDQLDPQRARVREDIRQQALRDATMATEAVRATLRANLSRGHRRTSTVRGSRGGQRAVDTS